MAKALKTRKITLELDKTINNYRTENTVLLHFRFRHHFIVFVNTMVAFGNFYPKLICTNLNFGYIKKIHDLFFFAGPLLEAVQMAAIYPDSKTFVDKKLKLPPGKIIKNFETLLNQHNGSLLSVDEIKKVRLNSSKI